jgi:monothiol glutaredoxin
MSLDPALHARIHGLVTSRRVVLFMKGTRQQPRCGFSATAIGALDAVVDDYLTVDVLADEDVRHGIKSYGNWPTIPQLYIDGDLVGGSDIIQQMLNTGELHRALGFEPPTRVAPRVTITEAAAKAIREAMPEGGDEVLHLGIDGAFRPQFLLKPADGHEVVAESNGLRVHFDLASARRADGIEIDWVDGVRGQGLTIRNPNAPPTVEAIDVSELKRRLDAGTVTVVDVRPANDRGLAPFAGAIALEGGGQERLLAMPKDTALAFLCHFGNSSRSAAEHFRGLGFTRVANVEGGIDAWAREIDPGVPRY